MSGDLMPVFDDFGVKVPDDPASPAQDRGDCICPNDAERAPGCPAHASSRFPPAQPDVDRLAAVLEATATMTPLWPANHRERAAAILAHPDMAQWAAEAEVGRAVLALEADGRTVAALRLNGEWTIHMGILPSPRGPTLPAAIKAVLEDGP